jgi:hypothetical protein
VRVHRQPCEVQQLDIEVPSTRSVRTVTSYLQMPQGYGGEPTEAWGHTAAILLSRAGGGVVGPLAIYLGIGDKLASLRGAILVLRMDYRYPARNKYCVPDVLAGMHYLENNYGIDRFVLVGWSFGGAPVFTIGGMDDRVVTCATVASQTAETEGIKSVGRKGLPVLLLHGTGDRTLSPARSQSLYERYGSKGGRREMRLFEGDDRSLALNAGQAEELLCKFIAECTGVDIDDEEQDMIQQPLIEDSDQVKKMRDGKDLRGTQKLN